VRTGLAAGLNSPLPIITGNYCSIKESGTVEMEIGLCIDWEVVGFGFGFGFGGDLD
jgi:hypothetical protein